jgi:AraC family transcriptional regulator, transcriptional activator of pobA
MSEEKDLQLLSEFKKSLRIDQSAAYSNLDERFSADFDFFAKRYEELLQVLGTYVPPHKWSYHRFGLLTAGEAAYTCGMYRFTAKKNSLLIIPAHTITTSEWTTDGAGYNLLFKFDFLLQNNLYFKSPGSNGIMQPTIQPHLPLTDVQAQQLAAIFETILLEKEQGNPLKDSLISLKIVELLILCERFYAEAHEVGEQIQTTELLKTFSALIEKHFTEEKSVAFYAREMHVHPNHLNAVVKANTGLTAKESIQNRVLLEAKYLLHTTGLSVKEIATHIGFDDPNYFTAFFKRMTDIAPGAYRSDRI